ncbi:type II toxin-antitoxin system VapC family toxin [soil metagenome]
MILVDTAVAFWMLSDPARLSDAASEAIAGARVVAVAGISWYELAWLIDAGRIEVDADPQSWMRDAAAVVTTLATTWEIAHRAADLSRYPSFPKDLADRLIYATGRVHEIPLVTWDEKIAAFDASTCVW